MAACSCHPEAIYYTTHARRGYEAMTAAGILPAFQGVAVHDHWKPYFRFEQVVHSLCGAHLLRELNYFDETLKHQWPAQLKQVLIDAKTAVAEAKDAQQTALSPEQMAELEQRYDQWVNHGLLIFPEQPKTSPKQGKAKQDPARNLLCRLRDFKDSVLRFIQRFDVPFDNNLAERAVRPVKVKLKVAGGFRAIGGAEAFCVLRSVWETDKLQGRNPFESLRAAFG
nr:transposase [Candidatus Thiothrix anitrata]